MPNVAVAVVLAVYEQNGNRIHVDAAGKHIQQLHRLAIDLLAVLDHRSFRCLRPIISYRTLCSLLCFTSSFLLNFCFVFAFYYFFLFTQLIMNWIQLCVTLLVLYSFTTDLLLLFYLFCTQFMYRHLFSNWNKKHKWIFFLKWCQRFRMGIRSKFG